MNFQNYSDLIIKKGVNLNKGEVLAVNADIEAAGLVEAVVKAAYEVGAKRVILNWTNAHIGKLDYKYLSVEELAEIPDWEVSRFDYMSQNCHAYLNIICEHPKLLKYTDPKKASHSRVAALRAQKNFRNAISKDKIRWCIAAYPNIEWAEQIFLGQKNCEKKLWGHMQKALRLGKQDYLAEWDNYIAKAYKRSEILNSADIKSLHFLNSLGTDLRMDLPKNYSFGGGMGRTADGRVFVVNLPTEEVGTAPDYRTVNGRAFASLPLAARGCIIKDFWFEFKDGRVVDFGAEEGYETLKEIIETDDGMKSLGEVSFVGYDSPIRQLNTIFYNTLFDENASCHLALGRANPSIEGGGDMTREELKAIGINDSIDHVDFMIGTKDLSITATTHDDRRVAIFRNGDWAI